MYIDDKGVVLRTVKYDDKSFIAHVFTESRGCVAFMVSIPRSRRSGMGTYLFQPLSFLSFQWDAKPTATLHRMKEARLLQVWADIPYNPVKRSVAMLLNEFMAHALSNEAENSDLYLYIMHSMSWFDAAERGYANFHLVFLLKLARFLGIAPNMEAYEEGCSFDLTRGCFCTEGMPSATMLDSTDAGLLFRLSETNYASMDGVGMNRHDRARMVRSLAAYYALHIPRFPALQSLEILQSVCEG